MAWREIKFEYIGYPILTAAIVFLISTFGVVFGGSVSAYFEPLSIIAIIFSLPLYPIWDSLLACKSPIPGNFICTPSGERAVPWFFSIVFVTILFYLVLGYLIAVCKETVIVKTVSKQGFAFRFSDHWRIVRIVCMLLFVMSIVAALFSLRYLPANFFAIL